MVHPVAEQGAVGQAGQRIMEGLVQQLLLEALPLGHVAGVEHDAVDDGIAQQVGGDDLGMERRAVGLPEAPSPAARCTPREMVASRKLDSARARSSASMRSKSDLPTSGARIVAQHP